MMVILITIITIESLNLYYHQHYQQATNQTYLMLARSKITLQLIGITYRLQLDYYTQTISIWGHFRKNNNINFRSN